MTLAFVALLGARYIYIYIYDISSLRVKRLRIMTEFMLIDKSGSVFYKTLKNNT